MAIQILPARLANQIAAGEVVERPASVVKELIENSLDAGATRIEIDIEKGGCKCIRIRDNGNGVCKDQLTLALSRHATSKISHLDDLESIVSLGFRGEALASISSVSRLTFTSKPNNQEQAWQAIAEGRDMQVNIQPAAHPQGTTVEVLDLFFNTPARRRFLKTEKTEFQHIDELIRRIALSSFEISLVLKHNGKVIRQYRSAQTPAQVNKRLATICGEGFVKSALAFENEELESNSNQLKISGWISDSLAPRLLGDVQYCYINGRMIRDKLVNHAIKQAYARLLPEGQFPGYVIYISCPANQVDVNVHPSKHEVRFHQARWVHDYIVSTLTTTLKSDALNTSYPAKEHDYQAPTLSASSVMTSVPSSSAPIHSSSYSSVSVAENNLPRAQGHSSGSYKAHTLDELQVNAYCDFVREAHPPIAAITPIDKKDRIEVISLIENKYALIKLVQQNELLLLSLPRAYQYIEHNKLLETLQNGEIIAQPLLLPVRIELTDTALQISERFTSLFLRLGFSFKKQANKLIISKVPALLRAAPVAKILPRLLDFLGDADAQMNEQQISQFCRFMIQQLTADKLFDVNEVQPLLAQFSIHALLAQGDLYIRPDLTLLLQGFLDE
ncbi:MAG: DNA mismatch repair endonuclease MutL [Psychromonas sp.]